MNSIVSVDTDEEIDRWNEAALMAANPPPLDLTQNKMKVYNKSTGQNDIVMPMDAGGFVVLGQEPIDRSLQIQQYARELRNMGVPFDQKDLEAAGYSAEEINAAGVLPVATEPPRTEPMSEGERLIELRSGGAVIEPMPESPWFGNAANMTLAEKWSPTTEIAKGLARGGLVRPVQFLKDNFGIYDPLYLQLIDPVTGEFDPAIKILSREEKEQLDADLAAGKLPYALDFEQLVEMNPDASAGAQFGGDLAQFIGAFAGIGKLFRIGNGIVAGFTQGAAADFLAFKGDEGRITDLLLEMGVPENQVTNFLKTDPNDPDYVGRFKTSLEGGIFGSLIEVTPLLLSMGKTFRAVKDGDVPLEELDQAINTGKQSLLKTAQNKLVDLGQAAETRIAERGSDTLYSGIDPSLIVDPILVAAGRAVAPKASDVTLGPASNIPMVSQLAPQYRVTLEGVQPGGTGKQSFVPKNMTPANFERTSTNLQTIADDFVDPLESQENYALMMGRVQNSTEVPAPPAWMIEHANDMDKWSSWFSGLTDDQIKAANEGLAVQNSFREAYAAGADTELTGQLMLWSILSRRLSAYPHESGYIELAEAARPFIQKAARGEWSDADTTAWLEMVPKAIPEGTPGKSATSNANDFGAVFLKKMAATDENGVSALTRLHELIADPSMSSAEVRRQYYGLAQDTGIKNKILSFALLVSGRNDVVVLDRIQINRMWGGGDKIYDNVYTQFDGAQGLAQYEALERSLQDRVSQLYERVGRGDVGSVGRYHWESWVLSSGQVVSHPTLETVVRSGAPKPGANLSATSSTPVMEGRFHRFDSGVQYEKLPDGSNRYIYRTSDGQPFQFTKKSLDAMFKEVKKKSSGVLPSDFPGVQSFEGGSIPWYEYEGVDRGKFDAIIRKAGNPIE